MSAGRWIETCGCGVETWVRNHAYEFRGSGDPTHVHPGFAEGGPTVAEELGWCGCGSPDDVDRMMLAYLTNINERWTTRKDEGDPHYGWRATPGLSEDAETLIQYIADSLDWTEHGGSVGGAWLTDDGRLALHNLAARP